MHAKELVTSWLRGRATAGDDHTLSVAPRPSALAEKFRAAYHWVVTDCIHCPYNDVEFGKPLTLGEGGQVVQLSRQTYLPHGAVPGHLAPLMRDGVMRLCFKPPIVG